MIPAIKRQVELFLIERMKAALPALVFYPYTGGDATEGATEIYPPFVVVAITRAERTMATEGTWRCEGKVQVITHHAETRPQEQSIMARDVYKALDNIGTYAGSELSVHGIDIDEVTSATDDSLNAHADIISFVAGVGG